MARDLIVRGGLVVDGTGAPSRRADVAVQAGRIVAVGDVSDTGAEEIDAHGCIVTPGFIDPHTHLDAQLCWDPAATPTSSHGVTSVVIGICGFGIAPCAEGGAEYLLRSLEVVEEIPFESTSRGVPFTWSTWPEFLDHLDRRGLAVNVGGLVPHSALRYFVMGERAREGPASADERDAMVKELARSLDGGALGFASSRGPNHLDAFGDPVPSRHADDDELRALVAACRGRIWQINLRTKFGGDAIALTEEVETYARWTEDAGARLTWSPLFVDRATTVWRDALDHSRTLNDHVVVAPQVSPNPFTTGLRFNRPSVALGVSGWRDVFAGFFDLSHAERRARMRDTGFRAALRTASTDSGPGLRADYDTWLITASPSRPDLVGQTLGAAAANAKLHPVDLLCDLMDADDLETQLSVPVLNDDTDAIASILVDPCTLVGLGDSGAHVMSVTNYSYPTYLLSALVRDLGKVPLEIAVERITRRPAELFGIRGRGQLAPGYAADIGVIDLEALTLGRVEVVNDLPGEAPRLVQQARGYRAVLVNGELTVQDDQLTGATPGHAIR